MIDRLRIAAHRAIGRVVMPDAPECPHCGSRFITVQRNLFHHPGKKDHLLTGEECQTCGASWSEGSERWEEQHPPEVWGRDDEESEASA